MEHALKHKYNTRKYYSEVLCHSEDWLKPPILHHLCVWGKTTPSNHFHAPHKSKLFTFNDNTHYYGWSDSALFTIHVLGLIMLV